MLREILGKTNEVWKKVSNIKDTPHAIGLGAAVGLGWNFIPSLGIGPFISVFTAKLFKGSGIAAITVNLGTGIFIPILYSLNMVTGRLLVGRWFTAPEIEKQIQESIQETIDNLEIIKETPSRFFTLNKVTEFGFEFFLGGLINALIFGVIIYGLIWLPRFVKQKCFCKN
ncbi:DUF2062 domain-containing protein [Anaerobranca gottschalkii]|uniref:DUF2062 domain-containing protein n=1 Tax=Anaerobranca gottschalkii DSM 13577 TaxID=1120990 RepID=A0A1I0AER3_9FIRM|nr:DUF2062 domain-containing protein [Anaerobranca gottschalkii]SES92174.1 hypothetical protein SAMN03080614_102018 [Anaerobranca gottschalkii DSM 13577]